MQLRYVVIFALVTLAANECEALRCFACSYTSANDHLCIDDPISVQGTNIVSCAKKYCTIFRQELQTPSGKVQSFLRDCQETPDFLNQVVEDDTFKTFYRSCTTDLCNSGDGLASGGSSLNPDNPGENLMIDGLDPNQAGGAPESMRGILLFVNGLLVVLASRELLIFA